MDVGSITAWVQIVIWVISGEQWVARQTSGRTAKRKWVLSNRAFGFLILMGCLFSVWSLLQRSYEQRVPALNVTVQAPAAPIIQMTQPATCTPSPRTTQTNLRQMGNNNQANPFTVNGNQTTNGTSSPIINGSSNQVKPQR